MYLFLLGNQLFVDITLAVLLFSHYDQIGAGDLPDDTVLTCSRGSDRYFVSFIHHFPAEYK